MKIRIFATVLALLVAFGAMAGATRAASEGSWTIEPSGTPNLVRFSIRWDDPGARYHDESSGDVDIRSLGLSSEQLSAANSRVTFTLAREAGSFACEGVISNGKGGGTYTFAPDPNYLAKLRARGYDDISPQMQMTAALVDVSMAYIDSIAAAGYPHLPYDKIVAFRALGIDNAYVRAMRSSFGSSAIEPDQLIALRALRVTDAYIAQMRAAGFNIATPQDAVRLRALRVDAAYVRDLAAVGYAHLTSEQLVQLRALQIDAAYIKRVRAHGFSNPTVEQLVRLKALNVI